MRIRSIVRLKKAATSDTNWRSVDVPPRFCPINSRIKPIRAGWEWRSIRAMTACGREFVAYFEINLRKGDFKSVLIEECGQGPSVIARFEYHSSHPGVHAHAHCDRGGIEIGATGMDKLARIPDLKSNHRRMSALSPSTFHSAASRFFGVFYDNGPLFN